MAIVWKNRGQSVRQTEGIYLRAQFKDGYGAPTSLDTFPTITIIQPNGLVLFGPSSQGIMLISPGLYQYNMVTDLNSLLGLYTDQWAGTLNGNYVWGQFDFLVLNTQVPEINSDGYISLGDAPGFEFDQLSLSNINKLIYLLKASLDSSGLHLSYDAVGNKEYMECDIYSIAQLTSFLILSLSLFNQTKFVTSFSFADTDIINIYTEVLIQGALVYALSSKALLEKARDQAVTDNGLSYQPAGIGDMLMARSNSEMQNVTDKIKSIKENFRPFPIGLSNYASLGSGRGSPLVRALRNRRERQLF